MHPVLILLRKVCSLIYKKDTLINSFKTIDGSFTISDLYLGNYYLIEKETLNGYVLNTNKIYFSLNYIDQYTGIVQKNITINNELEKGTLNFHKIDNENKPLKNAKIAIYSYKDNEDEAILIYEGYTDELGNIILNDLFIGKFYLIEMEAPDGYLLNNTKLYFEINKNADEINLEMINEPVKNKDFTFNVPNTSNNNYFFLILIPILFGLCYEKSKNY